MRGIEPPSKAWEAFILPLNHTRKTATKLHASLTAVKREQYWSRCSRRFQLSLEATLLRTSFAFESACELMVSEAGGLPLITSMPNIPRR